MKPVTRDELLPLGEYEAIRERFLNRMVADKRRRRVALGEHMTVLFENHDTVLFQIQEMLRTERITSEAGILHELETYNELVPGEAELSATVFVEYTDRAERDRMLVELAGLETCFAMEIEGRRVAARNETRATRTDRTTAVHYVKFPLGHELAERVRRGAAVALLVDHPVYRARTELGAEVLRSLQDDLA